MTIIYNIYYLQYIFTIYIIYNIFLHKIYVALISAEFYRISQKNYRVSQKYGWHEKIFLEKVYRLTKEMYDFDLYLSLRWSCEDFV